MKNSQNLFCTFQLKFQPSKTITTNINDVLCITEQKVIFGIIIMIITSTEERFVLRKGILRNPIL